MAILYATLIIKGDDAINPKTGRAYTVEDAPKSIRKQIQDILDAMDIA